MSEEKNKDIKLPKECLFIDLNDSDSDKKIAAVARILGTIDQELAGQFLKLIESRSKNNLGVAAAEC